MRTILTITPLIIAALLISCGPGIEGENDEQNRYVGEVTSTEGLIFYARMDEKFGDITDYYGRYVVLGSGNIQYSQPGGVNEYEHNASTSIGFDYSTSCFRFGGVSPIDLNPPYTISFLIYPTAIGPATIMGRWGTTPFRGWKLDVSAGWIVDYHNSPDGTGVSTGSGPSLNSFMWNHVVLTADANGNRDFYHNGNFSINIGTYGTPYTPPGVDFTIGCSDGTPGVGGENEFLSGRLDEIAIFNRQLSPDDIMRLNNARYN